MIGAIFTLLSLLRANARPILLTSTASMPDSTNLASVVFLFNTCPATTVKSRCGILLKRKS